MNLSVNLKWRAIHSMASGPCVVLGRGECDMAFMWDCLTRFFGWDAQWRTVQRRSAQGRTVERSAAEGWVRERRAFQAWSLVLVRFLPQTELLAEAEGCLRREERDMLVYTRRSYLRSILSRRRRDTRC